MPDNKKKHIKNVSGPFYVDNACTNCGFCLRMAPRNFGRAGGSKSYVRKQPENALEILLCEFMSIACPVGAVGDDGE